MKNSARRTLHEAKPYVRFVLFASLCLALGSLVSASGADVPDSRPNASSGNSISAERPTDSTVAVQPLFRLGNAAKPFGWSTAIGDFDSDGKPDVVVAEHAGQHAGAYAYRIEFSLSRDAAADVTFESADDAVTIRALDIDHDNDLDIIVGRPLSGDAVGIWLNDGHGHFTSADVQQFPSAMQPSSTLGTTDIQIDIAASDSSPRRAYDALPAAFRATPSDGGDRGTGSHDTGLGCAISLVQAAPRAPPQRFADA